MDAAAVNRPEPRGINWSAVVRVGIVVGLVALLVGFALKITWDQLVRKGIVQEGDYYRVDLKAMSNFDMDQVRGSEKDVPAPYLALNGKKVIMDGEVPPTGFGGGDFDLCYSVQRCCFSGEPQVQHFIRCQLPRGKRAPDYVEAYREVRVFGTLHIKALPGEGPGAKLKGLFQLDVERVEPR